MRRRFVVFRVFLLSWLLLGGAVLGQTPKERVEAQILSTRVRLALANDQTLRPFDFDVSAAGSAVTLRGRVSTEEQWARAVAIAERIPGVAEVISELSLANGSTSEAELLADDYAFDEVDLDSLDPMMRLEMEIEEAEEEPETEQVAAPEPAEPQIIYRVPDGYHMVEEGDTLLRISERYGVTIRQLREYNDLSVAAQPEVGELLRIKAP